MKLIDKAYIKAIAIDNLYSFESKLFSFSRRGLDKNEKNPLVSVDPAKSCLNELYR